MDYAVVFGDVFRYRGEEYVYFAESPEESLIFAGKILGIDETRALTGLEKKRQAKGIDTHKTPIYSYVVLSTTEFDKRAVLCAEGVDGDKQLTVPHTSLKDDDKEKIKQEILSGAAPQKLKKLVSLLA